MKRKILFTIIFFFHIFNAFSQRNDDVYVIESIKDIKEITVTKRNFGDNEKDVTVKLNEKQKAEFINRITPARKQTLIKVMLKYKATVYFNDGKTEEMWLSGMVIKKVDGTTYKLQNNIKLFINSIFSKEDTSKLYKEKIIKTDGRNIHVYQANYSRNDLIFLGGSGPLESPEILNCSFKIGQELIDVQDSFLKKKYLKNHIKNEKLIELADLYLKMIYDTSWKFSSYRVFPLDDKKEKWCIYFVFKAKNNKNSGFEQILMMPDGTIIISDNNYENIKFE